MDFCFSFYSFLSFNLKIKTAMKTFQEYDQENPHLWELYQMIALNLIKQGFRRIGSKRICEEIRWHHKVSTNEPYKIGNNYTAYYARKFAERYPEHSGLFKFKNLPKNFFISQ
jgi:hypothetical protein